MLTLRIPITLTNVEVIKRSLAKALPDVKSSHRVEAAARGLGFRTHASLLAATRSEGHAFGLVDGSRFSAYLAEHGFDSSSIHFYRAAGHVAIRSVLEYLPRLSMHGLGVDHFRQSLDGKRKTLQECQALFLESQRGFCSDHAVEEFLLALAFVSRIVPIKTINSKSSSYGLKHIAENYACTYPDGGKLGPHYVSNGSLIAAAVYAGFRFKNYVDSRGYESLNAWFNMSKRSIEDLDCEIRPNSVMAQDRARLRRMRSSGFRLAY